MINHTRRKLAATLALGLLCFNAQAANRYQIEVLIAEQTSRGGQAGTNWAQGFLLPRFSRLAPLNGQLGFNAVEPNALNSASAKLRSSGRYRVLAHMAWQQPAQADSGYAVQIKAGEPLLLYRDPNRQEPFTHATPATLDQSLSDFGREVPSAVLNGEIKVSVSRFLHLESQLVFSDISRGVSAQISAKRRMRSGEIHYLDNPTLAVFAIATPLN